MNASQPTHNIWLTTGMVASYCGVNRATILRWIKSGRLVAYTTPGGHHRVRQEDFRKFLAAMQPSLDEQHPTEVLL